LVRSGKVSVRSVENPVPPRAQCEKPRITPCPRPEINRVPHGIAPRERAMCDNCGSPAHTQHPSGGGMLCGTRPWMKESPT
jgi:hypothetical protein